MANTFTFNYGQKSHDQILIDAAVKYEPTRKALSKMFLWLRRQPEENANFEEFKAVIAKTARWSTGHKTPIAGFDREMTLLDVAYTFWTGEGFTLLDEEEEIWKKWCNGEDKMAEFRALASEEFCLY